MWTLYKCKKVNDVSAKGQTHTVGYAVGMQYAVGVSTKKLNSHSGVRSMQ